MESFNTKVLPSAKNRIFTVFTEETNTLFIDIVCGFRVFNLHYKLSL